MRTDDLIAKYADRALERDGCWLLDAATAIQFLEDLGRHQLYLYGVEGYWVRGESIQPSMADSVYFIGHDIRVASLPGVNPILKAKGFVQARAATGLMFDFDFGVDPIQPE